MEVNLQNEYKGGGPVPIAVGPVPELPDRSQIMRKLETSPKLNILSQNGII